MLIGLEASALYGRKSGVGYYTENLLRNVMRLSPDHRYVLFSNRDVSPDWDRLGDEMLYNKHQFPVRAAWMQANLPRAIRDVRPDICHFTNYLAPLFSSCPSVVTIYDMTLFVTPRFHNFKKIALDRTLIPHVVRRAKAIITVSNSARDDIVRLLRVPPGKVHVITGGVSSDFRPVSDPDRKAAVRARYGLHDPFILYVGTIEPRKNLTRLVQAFGELKRAGLPHKLVIVGQSGWHCAPIFAEVERLNLKQDVIFTGYVPFEDLPVLYSAAESMAFPSLYEGFGLPVIEAMACGAPVVTSRSSSLMEVAADAGLLVEPRSVGEIAAALRRLHEEPDLREELSRRGLARAAEFSWERSAQATLDLYDAVACKRTSMVGSPQRKAGARDVSDRVDAI